MSKTAHKRTPQDIEIDLNEVSRMYLTRVPILQIVKLLAESRPYRISKAQVIYDLNTLRARWRVERIKNMDERQAEELAKVDQLETEYWEAWRRSQAEQQKTTQEALGDGKKKASLTKQTSVGDPRFLDGVMKCIDKRCEILGLNAALQIEQTASVDVNVNVTDFDIDHARNAYREKLARELGRN